MIWKKHGLLLAADNFNDSMTHAVLPFVNWCDSNDCYYLYYSSRNHQNHASTYRVKISFSKEIIIQHSSRELVLSPGEIGFFDQHGAIGSSIQEFNGKKHLYYIGWTQGHESPLFYASIGLAISRGIGDSFAKNSNAPLISRTRQDPLLMTSPFIYKEQDNFYRLIYISGVKWKRVNGKLLSYYRICSAKSQDGIDWYDLGKVLIDFDSGETNFARPSVFKRGSTYVMFYSYKGSKHDYRIGMATSVDFIVWKRCDHKLSLNLGRKSDFDSEMMCYPSVFISENTLYLFYCGNNFGRDGIGYLTADVSEFDNFISCD